MASSSETKLKSMKTKKRKLSTSSKTGKPSKIPRIRDDFTEENPQLDAEKRETPEKMEFEHEKTDENHLWRNLELVLSIKSKEINPHELNTTLDEVIVYPIPSLQFCSLFRIYCRLSEVRWAAFILLCAGCTTAQLKLNSDRVPETSFQGWMMAIVMALLSGFAGVYTEAIIKKRPLRNINVQNFYLYVFGMIFNAIAVMVQDSDAFVNKGFFHGYSSVTILMIVNHALSGIAVSMVMKYADNIVKVYSTSVAMILTAVVSVFLFGFHLSLAFFLGTTVVSVSVYLHSIGKLPR